MTTQQPQQQSQPAPQMTFTPQRALAVLESIAANEPTQRQAAFNTISRETPKWVIQLAMRNKKLAVELEEVKGIVVKLLAALKATGATIPADAADAAAPAASAAAPPPPPPSHSTGTGRMAADGTEMTPEQIAIEEQMDAATSGMPVSNGAPKPGFGVPNGAA